MVLLRNCVFFFSVRCNVSFDLQMAFRLGSNTRLDERCFAMQQFKVMPLGLVMLSIYPKMYPIHELSDEVSPQ